ncbi:DUF3099 domain-containing protein [Sciscionella sediminilitoris]|uniref:DUF3099 domain-containing protein n=1 Tax=Sciscionella sediminilitoris TaxID=1445613 RepID=UPI0004DFC571|nr:DUF3099 domain-containing protein [Sciscionella sp. SE31]
MKRSEEADTPVLITEAKPSYDEELAHRKRRYMLTMGLRFPCLILAALFYHTWWLAIGFVVLSVPLPWIAVLMANDRPPRKSEDVNRYSHEPGNRLEAAERQTIEGRQD